MKIYLTKNMSECISTLASVMSAKVYDGAKKRYVFAEDKITLNIELKLAKTFGGGFTDIEVLTFKRYIRSRINGNEVLSKEASVMVIRKIIAELIDELKCFNASALKPNIALNIYELISQLESALISPNDLESYLSGQSAKNLALSNKIKDIALIYKAYTEHLKEKGVYDSYDYLSLMPSLILSDENLKGAEVYLVGYPSITAQRKQIFQSLNQVAKNVSAICLYSEGSEIYTGETYFKLKEIFKGAQILPSHNPLVEEAERIRKYLYNPAVFKEGFKPTKSDKIFLYKAFNPQDEIEAVAKNILREVREGKRFKDVVVAVGDLNSYAKEVKKYFSKYDIPYFIDKKTTLLSHPIARYILDYLDLVNKGFLGNALIKFVSHVTFNQNKELIDKFCEYVVSNSLSRRALKDAFTIEHQNLTEFEEIRSLAYKCFLYGKNSKTVEDYVLSIKKMLEETNAFKNMTESGEKFTKKEELRFIEDNKKVPQKLDELLGELQKVSGDLKISILDFKNVFYSGVSASTLGAIPMFNDAVYVGELRDVKIRNTPVLFALGLNGDIPFLKTDTAILSDTDIDELEKFKIAIEPKIQAVNKREKESVGLALISFTQKLYLSFADVGFGGEQLIKADIINYFTKMFSLLPTRRVNDAQLNALKGDVDFRFLTDGFTSNDTAVLEIAKHAQSFFDKDVIISALIPSVYSAINALDLKELEDIANQILTQTNNEKRLNGAEYFKDNVVATTVLEKYFECPYACYAKNLLKLQDETDGEMTGARVGTIMHAVVEEFVKEIGDVTDENQVEKKSEEILTKIINDVNYSKYLNSPKYEFLFKNLLEESKRVCNAIYESFKNSNFAPYLVEEKFNDFSKFKAIKLSTASGEFKIKGKVDRVDKFGDSIRIVDYKTGKLKDTDESFYTGRSLQLYLYMNAFLKEGIKPTGAYYFPIHDDYAEQEDVGYKMRGKTVDTNENIINSDTSLTPNSSSKYLNVRVTKDFKAMKSGSVITQEEMNKYLSYSLKVAKRGVEEMSSGYIKPTPYDKACDYCKFSGMCGFDTTKSTQKRKLKRVDKSTIINAVDEDDGDFKNQITNFQTTNEEN